MNLHNSHHEHTCQHIHQWHSKHAQIYTIWQNDYTFYISHTVFLLLDSGLDHYDDSHTCCIRLYPWGSSASRICALYLACPELVVFLNCHVVGGELFTLAVCVSMTMSIATSIAVGLGAAKTALRLDFINFAFHCIQLYLAVFIRLEDLNGSVQL